MRSYSARVVHLVNNAVWNLYLLVRLDLTSLMSIRRFYSHTLEAFGSRAAGVGKDQVLVELNSLYFSHPGYSYLLNALGKKYRAAPVAYSAYRSKTRLSSFLFTLRALIPAGKFLSYRSMGVNQFVKPFISRGNLQSNATRAKLVVLGLNNKQDLEDLEIDGIHVGDLIYGAFISIYREPSVSLGDPRLRSLVADFLGLLGFWKSYFSRHGIKAVVSSHLVYEMGLPARVALSYGVEAFHFIDTGTGITRVNPVNSFYGFEHEGFANRFSELSTEQQELALELAERRLSARFSGLGDPDLNPSAARQYRRQTEGSGKPGPFDPADTFRVLIAGQLFWDSPHKRGKALFSDFYEWLVFLGEFSAQSEHSWYVKGHPDGKGQEDWMYQEIVLRFPHLKMVPPDVTHHEIFSAGVDVALTVHGTIGFEYPLHGIPVVNASTVHPHIAFDFSVTPKSLEEYLTVLRHLESLTPASSRHEILKYYFIKNIYFTPNIFFDDYQGQIRSVLPRNSAKAFDAWIAQWGNDKHQTLVKALDRFVASQDDRLCWRHYGLDGPREYLFFE